VIKVLRAHPSSLASARAFIRDQASRCSVPKRVTEDLALLVTEACSNVVAHSGSPRILVSWQVLNGAVEVQVKDDGMFRRRVHAGSPDFGGWGTSVLLSFADEFTIRTGTESRPGTLVRLVKRTPARVPHSA
jgi:anti-sigma regulatory factor (Ser/Thr protein kinase)